MSQPTLGPTLGPTTGILQSHVAAQKFRLTRHAPTAELGDLVLRYWIIHWDSPPGDSHAQETLPYPCVNLVIESSGGQEKGDVFGVITPKYMHRLGGVGRVFGIKFRPAGFRPFARCPMAQLTDHALPIAELFGPAGDAFHHAILALDDEEAMVTTANQFLRDRLPATDETVAFVNHTVELIVAERTLTRVEDVADRVNVSPRTLQCLFREYVGVSPKWVIRQFRLHEAAARLDDNSAIDLAQLALELGYFDQAHFVKDFTATVGLSPTAYTMSSSTTSSS